jgi:hypothetical protein
LFNRNEPPGIVKMGTYISGSPFANKKRQLSRLYENVPLRTR